MPDHTKAIIVAVISIVAIAIFVLHRWMTSPSRAVARWLRQIEAGETPDLPVRTDFDFDLVQTDVGFEIRPLRGQTGEVVIATWQRVTEASAYKRDMWSTDQICIAFTLDDGTYVEIHEEMRGFADLCKHLPTALPGALPFESWYMDISVPAFETCLTRLFTRDSTPQPA
jgi:hypothetical protein